MDNNLNEIYENERYTVTLSPEEHKEIFKITTKSYIISTILLTSILLIVSVYMFLNYEETYGTYAFLLSIVFALIRFYRFAVSKRNMKENMSNGPDDDVYEILDDKIIYSNIKDGELITKFHIPYDKIVSVTENENYLLLQFDNKIFSLRKADIAENSMLTARIDDVNKRLKKQRKYALGELLISIAIMFSVSAAAVAASFAENHLMTPSYWVYLPFLIFPAISFVYAHILKKKKYHYFWSISTGIIIAIVLIVCGCRQIGYCDYFGYSSNVVSAAGEKLGIDIPPLATACSFYNDNYSEDENIEIIYETYFHYYYDVISNTDIETCTENPVWLDELPDEFIDVIPDYDLYMSNNNFILYNVDTGEINKAPTEQGEHRLVFMTFYDFEYGCSISIIEYNLTL